MTIDIIGAGIGGLTTAVALQKKGIKTRIFEQAKAFKPVGAGIILANNAMQVYERLGLRNEIAENGNRISSISITNARMKAISTMDLTYFEEKNQVQNIAIHRGTLQQILVNQLDKNTIHLDSELINITAANQEYELKFGNGHTAISQQLLGADGLNSKVRNCLFTENKIRHAQQVCWRGVTEFSLPIEYQHELNEAWGKGDRFGFVQIAPNRVYWFALKSFKQDPKEFSVDELSIYFKSYHPIIQNIIKTTAIQAIHTATISDLQPIKKWHNENVCLIGDAAHATTPNMGQGACQAIEDAYILAECLEKYELNKAFSEYQKLRMSKAHRVVNMSWTVGKLAHWKNPLAIQFRNQVMSMAPKSSSRKQTEKIFQLESV